MYKYDWIAGQVVPDELLQKFSDLYSGHYGVWGVGGRNPGQQIKLTPSRLRREWLGDDTHVVWATMLGEVVGYAITVQSTIPSMGDVAWVTQLVVHEDHRQKDVAQRLLFTAWKFTDFFAWGLLSANPYAVRALEKATRRKCIPQRIAESGVELRAFGSRFIHYVEDNPTMMLSEQESRIDTEFFVDHSDLPNMLATVQSSENPWRLGVLPEGWEWFAFTFRDQEPTSLSHLEIEEMLRTSDEVTQAAYARMLLESPEQRWAAHYKAEVDFALREFSEIQPTKILDVGCAMGRHSIEIASRGIRVAGVDYVPEFIERAKGRTSEQALENATFTLGDCKSIVLDEQFDAAICPYDVVGSCASDLDNRAILKNLVDHIKPSGLLLLSVMNMELTVRKAVNWFSLDKEPDRLLSLKPSATMERSGNIFDPEYYMIEMSSYLIYRKEQFRSGAGLPEEFIIRDRRYNLPEIEDECTKVGLDVVWSRFVRSGRWTEALPRDSEHAKEILLLCRKPEFIDRQLRLF